MKFSKKLNLKFYHVVKKSIVSRFTKKLSFKSKLIIAFLFILITVMSATTIYYLNDSTKRTKAGLNDSLNSSLIAVDIMMHSEISKLNDLCVAISNDNSITNPLALNVITAIPDYCNALLNKYNNINDFVLLDASGKVIFSTGNAFETITRDFSSKDSNISGFFLQGSLYIISFNTIKDSSGNKLGGVLIAHDLEKDTAKLSEMSLKIKNFCLLYKGNNLIAMTDANGEVYHPLGDGYGAINSEIIFNSNRESYYSSNARKLFDINMFINYQVIRDVNNKPVGLLAVADTDKKINDAISTIVINMSVILLISIIIALALILLFASRTTKPIRSLVNLMEKVEKGDLTVKGVVINQDEIGVLTLSFNKMVEELSKIVNTIITHTESISKASTVLIGVYGDIKNVTDNISNSIKEIAIGTESTSASVEETHACIEEIASEASNISADCENSSNISLLAVENAKKGVDSITIVKEFMNNLSEESQHTLSKTLELEQYSNKINSIVKVVMQISDNITLLALNALIEAARAGVYGKTFSVVAQEINKLGQNTKRIVQEIIEYNKEIIHRVHDTVTGIKSSTDEIEKGVLMFEDLERKINSITNSIYEVDTNLRKITDASINQASTTQEIVSTMDHIATISAQTASSTSNIYDASKKLIESMDDTSRQIDILGETVTDLKELTMRFKV